MVFEDRRKYNQPPDHASKLINEVSVYLLADDTLNAWAGFSLRMRVNSLFNDKQVRVSIWALRNFYSKHNIRYRVSNYTYN